MGRPFFSTLVPFLLPSPFVFAFSSTVWTCQRAALPQLACRRTIMGSPKSRADPPESVSGTSLQSHGGGSTTTTRLSAESFGFSDTSAINLDTDDTVSFPSTPWKAYPSWQYEKLVERHGEDHVKLIYMVRHAEGTHNVNREYKDMAQLDARLTAKGKDQCRKLRDELLSHQRNVSTQTSVQDYGNHRQGLHHLLNLRSVGEAGNSLGEGNSGSSSSSSNNDVCVVTSPLSRCVETALLSFEFMLANSGDDDKGEQNNRKIPFLAHESLRETVNYSCDRRRPISEIAVDFPEVDFSHCVHDDDVIWSTLLSIKRYRKEHEEGGHLESAELHLVARRGAEALEFLQNLPHSKVVVCTHSAYLRCMLSWGHPGGVPLMVEQRLDQRKDPLEQEKLLEYSCILYEDADAGGDGNAQKKDFERGLRSFELYMREDYANAELRSFCLLAKN